MFIGQIREVTIVVKDESEGSRAGARQYTSAWHSFGLDSHSHLATAGGAGPVLRKVTDGSSPNWLR